MNIWILISNTTWGSNSPPRDQESHTPGTPGLNFAILLSLSWQLWDFIIVKVLRHLGTFQHILFSCQSPVYRQFCSLCFSIMINLIGLRDAQVGGRTLFFGISVTVFPEELIIWICRLSKKDCSYHSGQA